MVSPPHRRSGRRRGFAPSPEIFFDFRQRNGVFWRILQALYFTIQLPALRTESAYIGDRYS